MTHASATAAAPCPRLDLRVLQTNTDRRFAFLLFTLFSMSLYIFHTEMVTIFLGSSISNCIAQSLTSPSSLTLAGLNFSCAQPIDTQLLLALLPGELLLLGGACGLYWLLPIWKCWRERLRPLRGTEWEQVNTYVEQCSQEYLAGQSLHYVWNVSPSRSPRVFGRRGKYYLFLPYGFLILFETDRKRFHATLLHELAHVYNRDAGKYYFVRSAVSAFVGICLLPFVLFQV